MSLTSLGIASRGLLDGGASPMLHLATEGLIRLDGAVAAPVRSGGSWVEWRKYPIGSEGKYRKYLRTDVMGEVIEDAEDALKAIRQAKARPNKQKLRKVRSTVNTVKFTAATILDPAVKASLIGSAILADQLRVEELTRIEKQLNFLAAAMRQFEIDDKREQDAVIALLLAI